MKARLKPVAAAVALLLLLWALLFATSKGFEALFTAWGLTTANLSRAPSWARMLVGASGQLCRVIAYGAVCALALPLSRRLVPKRTTERFSPAITLAGCAAGLCAAGLALLTDSVRLDSVGSLTLNAILTLAALCLSTLTVELITKRFIDDGFGNALVSALAFALLSGAIRWQALLTFTALGFVGVKLYRTRGFWTTYLCFTGWRLATTFLFSWIGAECSIVRLYTVSEAWLFGDGSPEAGCLALIASVAAAVVLWRAELLTFLKSLKRAEKKAAA